MGCPYYYNIAICDLDPVEDNYEDFLNWESSRSERNYRNKRYLLCLDI